MTIMIVIAGCGDERDDNDNSDVDEYQLGKCGKIEMKMLNTRTSYYEVPCLTLTPDLPCNPCQRRSLNEKGGNPFPPVPLAICMLPSYKIVALP